jgi:hypothetical protein
MNMGRSRIKVVAEGEDRMVLHDGWNLPTVFQRTAADMYEAPGFHRSVLRHSSGQVLVRFADGTTRRRSYEYGVALASNHGGADFAVSDLDATGVGVRRVYDERGNETAHYYVSNEMRREDWQYNEFGQVILHMHPEDENGHRHMTVYEYRGPNDDPRKAISPRCVKTQTGSISRPGMRSMSAATTCGAWTRGDTTGSASLMRPTSSWSNDSRPTTPSGASTPGRTTPT